MQNFTGIFTGFTGLLVIGFILVTAILYFLIPWMIKAINKKTTVIVSELKLIVQLLREIKADNKKRDEKLTKRENK